MKRLVESSAASNQRASKLAHAIVGVEVNVHQVEAVKGDKNVCNIQGCRVWDRRLIVVVQNDRPQNSTTSRQSD